MIFFNKIVSGSQELTAGLRDCVYKKEPPTLEQADKWYRTMKLVTRAIHERLFVVMTAQAKGWQFAKDLDFFQSGAKI